MREERKAKASVPTPHIAALPGDIAETVLLPGDRFAQSGLRRAFWKKCTALTKCEICLG